MRLRLALVLLSVALDMFGVTAISADAPQQKASDNRVCAAADLAGTYVQIDFREIPPGGETQWKQQFPYGYLQFRPERFYGLLAVDYEVPTASKLKSLMETVKFWRYTLSDDGILSLYMTGKIRSTYRCVFSLTDANGYRKGDLVFFGYSKGRKNELYRHYRRWF